MRSTISQDDSRAVEERRELRPPLVYEVVRSQGDAELVRPAASLWWSGVAAGLVISTSVLAEGFLRHSLPDASWRPAVDNLGYTLGFLLVILGRLQLFTENTITVVLPVLAKPTIPNFARLGRLWGIVFAANMVGALVAAVLIAHGGVIPEKFMPAITAVSAHFAEKSALEALLHGAPAGFLIAALVWMGPSLESGRVLVIMIVTYVIALGDFSHVVAGAVEAFFLLVLGEISPAAAVFGLIAPTLIGNILGGTGLFALLAYAQVRDEMPKPR